MPGDVVCAGVSASSAGVATGIRDAARGVQADVSDEADVRRLIATAEETFGRIDILVSNAGFGGGVMPLHEQITQNWNRVRGVNLRAVLFCMKCGILSLRRTVGGFVVNVSPTTAVVGWKHHGPQRRESRREPADEGCHGSKTPTTTSG